MTEAELIWKLVGALALILAMAVSVKKVFFSRTPQPFEVASAPEWVTRRECNVAQANFELRLATLERRFDAHLVDVKADITELHEKLNTHHADIMRALGRLEGAGG
jgi:hypothetical protein